tara:strand:- start:60720 stop:61307 length:588 start_codon:yes stop_codon:yes gene_type:complete
MDNPIIYIPTERYVYFDDDGNLLSVSNANTDEGMCLKVELADVINLISGKEQFSHYQVIFDTLKKTYILKHVFNEEVIQLDVNSSIYKIPKLKIERPDLTIIQDIKNKEWVFSLDVAIRDNFLGKNLHLDKTLYFNITRYNDPHQLEKIFTISINELLINDTVKFAFDLEIELDVNALSVYTTKRLETYCHEVNQ